MTNHLIFVDDDDSSKSIWHFSPQGHPTWLLILDYIYNPAIVWHSEFGKYS